MRFVIADLDGASHARFDSFSDAARALDEIAAEDPSAIDELMVLRYDDDGTRTGAPIPAGAVVAQTEGPALVGTSESKGPASTYAEDAPHSAAWSQGPLVAA